MSPTWKAVLALVFTAALGWVLLRPVLEAVEQDPLATRAASPSPSPETTAAPDPSPQPTETQAGEGELPEEFRTASFVSAYPARCLRPTPPDADVVAVDRGDEIAAGPLGGPLTELPGDTLLGVGVDGRVAGRAGNEVFIGTPDAERMRSLPDVRLVVWSPVSRCGVAVSRGGALVVLPSEQTLVEGNVRTVAFSPDGRMLALVLREDQATSLWIAGLAGGPMRELLRESPGSRIDLRAWSPAADTLYLTMGENEGLSFVAGLRTSAVALSGRVVATPVKGFEYCGARLLAVVEGGIAQITTRGPRYLTARRSGYTAVSCSPDGAFLAALRSGDLLLLNPDGALLRDLTTDAGYRDVFVDWGPRGAGVLFGRQPDASGDAQLWHIAEGGSAASTGITYRGGPHAVDWAASPPTGMP